MPIDPSIRDHERTDANAKWVFVVVLGLFVCGVALHGILAGFLRALKHTPATADLWEPVPRASHPAPTNAPYPRLQVSPPLDLKTFQAREEAELHGYGWIDRRAGKVRIPIERAMDLVLTQGLPVRQDGRTNSLGPSPFQLIQQRAEHQEPRPPKGSE
jgi:hypothetical protein